MTWLSGELALWTEAPPQRRGRRLPRPEHPEAREPEKGEKDRKRRGGYGVPDTSLRGQSDI